MTLVGLAARKLSIKKRNAKLAAAFPNGVRCQKCLELGHWSYECKEKRKFVHRTSRSKHLKKRLAENEAAKVQVDSNDNSSKHAALSTKKLKAGGSADGNVSNSDSQSSSSDGSDSTDTDEDSSDDTSSSGSDSESSSSGSGSDSSSSESSDSSSSDDDEETASPKKKKSRQSSSSSSSSSDNEDDI